MLRTWKMWAVDIQNYETQLWCEVSSKNQYRMVSVHQSFIVNGKKATSCVITGALITPLPVAEKHFIDFGALFCILSRLAHNWALFRIRTNLWAIFYIRTNFQQKLYSEKFFLARTVWCLHALFEIIHGLARRLLSWKAHGVFLKSMGTASTWLMTVLTEISLCRTLLWNCTILNKA